MNHRNRRTIPTTQQDDHKFNVQRHDMNAAPIYSDPNRHKTIAESRIQLAIPGLMESLRKQLTKRGSYGFTGLAKKFHLMDKDHSNTLSIDEFKEGIQKVGVQLTERQVNVIFDHLDQDKNGSINFE